jgi:hypothetical protein
MRQTDCSLSDRADERTAQIIMGAAGAFHNATSGPSPVERVAFTGEDVPIDLAGDALADARI